jgi:hypothetical protein
VRRTFFLFITVPAVLVGSVLLTLPLVRCTTNGTAVDVRGKDNFLQNPEDAPKGTDLQILAHSGQADGMRLQDLPVWLATYIRSGTQGLEALPDYGENYAFVIENRVSSLQEIRSWVAACNPMKALSFHVTRRINKRMAEVARLAAPRTGTTLTGAAADFVQAAEEAFYGGAREINRWWIQTKNTEYRGYIFLVMDQEMLDRQLRRLMVDNDFTFTQEERTIWMSTRF